MSPSKHEKYSLLQNQNADDEGDPRDDANEDVVDPSMLRFTTRRNRNGWPNTAIVMSLAGSAVTNIILAIILVVVVRKLPAQSSGEVVSTVSSTSTISSAYAGLQEDPSVHFPYSIGYGPEITNHSLADERWEAIDINSGIVALPQDWIEQHNLPPSQPFPWDASKGVYTITAFHTLHCLKNIHRLLYDAHHGRPLSRDIGHAMHCVDHMRKDAMCTADDYLLPTPPERYGMQGPRGQSRVCRDWDQLLDWADQHHACYQHLSDDEEAFARDHDEIERYRNCPAGSPYEPRMRAFFEEAETD